MRSATVPTILQGSLDTLTVPDSVGNTPSIDTELTIDTTTDKPLPPHLSFSQLDMYRRCSMQYYFRYIKGMKDRPNLALTTGKAGHAALEANGRRTQKTGAPMPLVELTDKFSDHFDAEASQLESSDIQPWENADHSKDSAILTLKVYHAQQAPTFRPALIEHEFNLDLNKLYELEHPIKIINGRIDYIDINDGIGDYKWTGKAKNQNDIDLSPQLTLYDMVYLATFGIEAKSLAFMLMLPPGKSLRDPAPARAMKMERSPEFMTPSVKIARRERLVHMLSTTTKAIDAGIFQPSDNPITCSWCGYRDKCQFNLAGSDWQAIAIRQKGTA